MFITVGVTTALVSVAINAVALGVAGHLGYRYAQKKYAAMKEWVSAHEGREKEEGKPE